MEPGQIVTMLMTLLGAGGGFALVGQWMQVRKDKRLGLAAQATADDESMSRQWQAIVEMQVKALVNPLQAEVEKLTAEVAHLRDEVATVRARYWKAIVHARELRAALIRQGAEPPAAPADIAGDL